MNTLWVAHDEDGIYTGASTAYAKSYRVFMRKYFADRFVKKEMNMWGSKVKLHVVEYTPEEA